MDEEDEEFMRWAEELTRASELVVKSMQQLAAGAEALAIEVSDMLLDAMPLAADGAAAHQTRKLLERAAAQ